MFDDWDEEMDDEMDGMSFDGFLSYLYDNRNELFGYDIYDDMAQPNTITQSIAGRKYTIASRYDDWLVFKN